LDVIVRDLNVERVYAGDKILATGTLAVVPDASGLARAGENAVSQRGGAAGGDMAQGVTGTKMMGSREMTYKLVFVACDVESTNQQSKYDDFDNSDDEDEALTTGDAENAPEEDDDELVRRQKRRKRRELALCERMRKTPQLYDALAQSIAPAVYGHADIKRGILLQLVGGVHKVRSALKPLVHSSPRDDPPALPGDARGHQAARRHKRLRRGRPVNGQVAIFEVRLLVHASGRLHFRQSRVRRRLDGVRRARRRDGRVLRRGRRAHVGRQRHLLCV
jgi:hypothetical protein